MAKYRVITLAMSVKNNRIAEFGEFVDDSELTVNPSKLIAEGFIEAVEEDDVIDAEAEVVETKTEKELLSEKYFELTGETVAKNISIDKLKAKLAEAEAKAEEK